MAGLTTARLQSMLAHSGLTPLPCGELATGGCSGHLRGWAASDSHAGWSSPSANCCWPLHPLSCRPCCLRAGTALLPALAMCWLSLGPAAQKTAASGLGATPKTACRQERQPTTSHPHQADRMLQNHLRPLWLHTGRQGWPAGTKRHQVQASVHPAWSRCEAVRAEPPEQSLA